MAYTNELSYLLEDDYKSIELVHAAILYPQLIHIKYFVLYYYLFTQLLIASDVVPTLHVYINSKNNSDVVIYITLIMKYSIENHIRISV